MSYYGDVTINGVITSDFEPTFFAHMYGFHPREELINAALVSVVGGEHIPVIPMEKTSGKAEKNTIRVFNPTTGSFDTAEQIGRTESWDIGNGVVITLEEYLAGAVYAYVARLVISGYYSYDVEMYSVDNIGREKTNGIITPRNVITMKTALTLGHHLMVSPVAGIDSARATSLLKTKVGLDYASGVVEPTPPTPPADEAALEKRASEERHPGVHVDNLDDDEAKKTFAIDDAKDNAALTVIDGGRDDTQLAVKKRHTLENWLASIDDDDEFDAALDILIDKEQYSTRTAALVLADVFDENHPTPFDFHSTTIRDWRRKKLNRDKEIA